MQQKRYTLLLIGLLALLQCIAEPTPNRVVILGTKHNGNKQLTVKSLLATIQKINPDIILLEFDSTIIKDCNILPVIGAKTAEFLGIWKNPVEYSAARKYKEQKQAICIAAFDVFIPNRKKYILYTNMMEKSHQDAINTLFNNHQLSYTHQEEYTRYTNFNNALLNSLNSSLIEMNRSSLTDTIQQIIQMEKSVLHDITQQYHGVQPYSNWYKAHTDFWEERNTGMCNKIAQELLANSGKTILVLTGLMHKYALENFLRKKEMEKFCQLLSIDEAFLPAPIF